MEQYGYIRVSTKEQNPERQFVAMEEQKIKSSHIFLDQLSGKDFERPQYHRMLEKLQKGDVVVIKSIDRLGRNYGEILEEWRRISKEIGANIQVLDMPLLNTGQNHNDLTGVFISDLVLQILAYVAETERKFIRQRQAEGIAVAKRNGVHFGRKEKEKPRELKKYYCLWKKGEVSVRGAASALGLSSTTFYRWCKQMENES